MNAEEFRSVLRELTDILNRLSLHRLELEKAELDTPAHGPTSECDTVSQSQLAAVEKRLDKIKRVTGGTDRQIAELLALHRSSL